MPHIEDRWDTPIQGRGRLIQRNRIQCIQDDGRPYIGGLLGIVTQFPPRSDEFMIALFAQIALFPFKKTFLDDSRCDDSTYRTDRYGCVGYEFIELNEIEDFTVEFLFLKKK